MAQIDSARKRASQFSLALYGFAQRETKIDFIALLIIFSVVYFGVCLPIFQQISKRKRGRKFVIRLGMAWNAKDPEHRWDVLMSFLSFVLALAIAMYLFDLVIPFQENNT